MKIFIIKTFHFDQMTKSFVMAEKFKYDLQAKRRMFDKILLNPLKIPVIVYTINPSIPDLTRVEFLVSKWIDTTKLLEYIINNLGEQFDGNFGVRLEYDLDSWIVDDITIEELYEYERNKDGFLYLVFDVK